VVTFDNMPDYSVQRYCFDFRDTRFPVMPLWQNISQTSKNTNIQDYILCTCNNMALQPQTPPTLTMISATIQKFLLDPITLVQYSL
jgi:hypothetical protein